MAGLYGFSGASTPITRREQMKAIRFLSACSVALALMIVAPALAQEKELLTEEDQEEELLTQEVGPLAVPFFVVRVAVECNGNCGDITLGQACGTGFTPIAVDCQNVQEQAGVLCGSPANNRCSHRTVSSSDFLDRYCDDSSGWDANVYCAQ
jgi:hypothetical protein